MAAVILTASDFRTKPSGCREHDPIFRPPAPTNKVQLVTPTLRHVLSLVKIEKRLILGCVETMKVPTTITPELFEKLLQWLFFGALLYVVIRALVVMFPHPDPILALVIVTLGLSEPAAAVFLPNKYRAENRAAFTLADAAIAIGLFNLTGGTQGGGHFLLYLVIALAAARLSLGYALATATLTGLLFSTNLIVPLSSPLVERNIATLATDLLSYYAVVFIIHFFVAGQRETGLRLSRENALAEARRLIDQQRELVRLSREISNASSLEGALQIVLQTIRQLIPFDRGTISLLDPHHRLYVAASDQLPSAPPEEEQHPTIGAVMNWIMEHQLPFYSPDLEHDVRVVQSDGRSEEIFLSGSILGAPLVSRGQFVGILKLRSLERNDFTDEHRRLLETVAAQVAGAIENARLFDERREFSRQLQSVYETANELTSNFDLDFILERFAERAAELLNARYAAAAITDTQGNIANFVTTGLSLSEQRLIGLPPTGHGLLASVFHSQTPIRFDDISAHPDSAGFPAHHPPMRTLLGAPLISRGESHGAIYVSEKLDGEPFTSRDEELLMMLTAGASAAVSNARLYNQLRHNIEQLYALYQIGQAIGSSLSWTDVIGVFTRDVKRLCGAEAIIISQWNAPFEGLSILSADDEKDLMKARESPGLIDQLTQAARSGESTTMSLKPSNGNPSRLYGLAVPLYAHSKTLGLAEAYSLSPSLIASEASSLFRTLVSELAVGMENSRLYGELQRREQQLRNFVVRLFQAQDEERRRMAYDIHDGLAQLIVSADMHLSNFASFRHQNPELAETELEKGLLRLTGSLKEVRRVVSELRPSTLDDFGLAKTVRRHLEELAAEQNLEISFEENLGETRLEPTLETGVYRIVQESLNNMRKHSQASRVQVALMREGDLIHIRVQDWGKGFNVGEAQQLDGHFGLRGMEERARLLGGTCEIESIPGQGTTVSVTLPCYLAVPLPRA